MKKRPKSNYSGIVFKFKEVMEEKGYSLFLHINRKAFHRSLCLINPISLYIREQNYEIARIV